METCRINNIGGIKRLFSGCSNEARFGNWQNQSNPSSAELLCPHPRRSFNGRSDFSFDSFGSVDFDILQLILTENESSDDSESEITNNETDFFNCESPPIRSNNPLINDPEFQFRHDYYVSVNSSNSASQRLSRSFSPSFISSPKKRVEGFSCGSSTRGSSKSNRVCSALA